MHGWEAGATGARICRSAPRWRRQRAEQAWGPAGRVPSAPPAHSWLWASPARRLLLSLNRPPHAQGRDPRRSGVASGLSPPSHFSTPPPLSAPKKTSGLDPGGALAPSRAVPRRRTQHPHVGPPGPRRRDSGTAPPASCSSATGLQSAATAGSPYGQAAPFSPHCTPPPAPLHPSPGPAAPLPRPRCLPPVPAASPPPPAPLSCPVPPPPGRGRGLPRKRRRSRRVRGAAGARGGGCEWARRGVPGAATHPAAAGNPPHAPRGGPATLLPEVSHRLNSILCVSISKLAV